MSLLLSSPRARTCQDAVPDVSLDVPRNMKTFPARIMATHVQVVRQKECVSGKRRRREARNVVTWIAEKDFEHIKLEPRNSASPGFELQYGHEAD